MLLSIYNMELTLQILVLLPLIQHVVSISKYQMNNYCDGEISFGSEWLDQLKLEFVDDGIYGRKQQLYPYNYLYSCETRIQAWWSTYPKLMFYFEDLNLNCDDGYLLFLYGKTVNAHVPGLERQICGKVKPKGVYTVDTRYFRIKYIPSKTQFVDDIFSIIITTYSEGYCPSYAHMCKNSRCIDKDLVCNGYDSCGDGSGCDLSTGAIVGMVSGSLVGLALIIGCIVCCICCKRRTRQRPRVVQLQNPAEPQVTNISSNQQGICQPTYGVNHGAYYSSSQAQASPYSNNQAPYPVMSQNASSSEQQSSFSNPMYDGPPSYDEIFRNGENSQQSKDGSSSTSYANPDIKTVENQFEEIRY